MGDIINHCCQYSVTTVSFYRSEVEICFFDKVENAASQLIEPLERFRKDQIGEAKVQKLLGSTLQHKDDCTVLRTVIIRSHFIS